MLRGLILLLLASKTKKVEGCMAVGGWRLVIDG